MGRRALRKIDPALDLSRHLVELDDLHFPLDLQAIFEKDGSLEVEVGSGKGLFMRTASGEFPERNFLGCEIARKYARFAAAKLAKLQRSNAVMIHGDASRLFTEGIRDACLDAVHVYFPDPWWKKRHRRRRIMSESFLGQVERTLKAGGRLHFWTDVQEYFESTLELIAQCTGLDGPIPVDEQPADHDLDYRTHFERRMRLHGEAVYRSQFLRT